MSQTQISSKSEQRIASRWIPKDSSKIEHELGVCYVQDQLNTPRQIPIYTVMGYAGTAGKSSFYESYRTPEARDQRVARFFADLESSAVYKSQRKAERNQPHELKVGEIITNSWGYYQTNVDMYVIVKATRNYVWLQPIAGEHVPSEGCGPMSGYVKPKLPVEQILTREVREYGEWEPGIGNRVVGLKTVPIEPTMHKAEKRSVHFDHGCGSVWEGRALYESWYA